FHVELYAAFKKLLPVEMMSFYEGNAKGRDSIDLLVTENNNIWAGFEFKVEKITASDFEDPLKQVEKYLDYFKELKTIYLVNFYLETSMTPVIPKTADNIVVVNIKYNKDCTKFEISTSNGDKVIVNNNLQSTLF